MATPRPAEWASSVRDGSVPEDEEEEEVVIGGPSFGDAALGAEVVGDEVLADEPAGVVGAGAGGSAWLVGPQAVGPIPIAMMVRAVARLERHDRRIFTGGSLLEGPSR